MARSAYIVTGDKRLTRMLNSLGTKLAKKLHAKAAKVALKPVLREARVTSPVATGALRRSLTVRVLPRNRKGKLGAMVTTREGLFRGATYYGGFIELGWRAGKRTKLGAANPEQDTRRKIPGRWFMKQAGDATESEAVKLYESELLELILSEARG